MVAFCGSMEIRPVGQGFSQQGPHPKQCKGESGQATDWHLSSAHHPDFQTNLCGRCTGISIETIPGHRQDRKSTVNRVRDCSVINKQVHGDETRLRPSWKVVHRSGSGSMRSMSRHRHGCDRAVNRHTSNQTSSDWY